MNENFVDCFRTCLQILIVYFLHTSNMIWITQKETIQLKKSIKALKKIIFQSIDLSSIQSKSQRCFRLAVLFEKKENIKLLQTSIIKSLSTLMIFMRSNLVFEFYNSIDQLHIHNVMEFLFKIVFQFHHLMNTTFTLIINFVKIKNFNHLNSILIFVKKQN